MEAPRHDHRAGKDDLKCESFVFLCFEQPVLIARFLFRKTGIHFFGKRAGDGSFAAHEFRVSHVPFRKTSHEDDQANRAISIGKLHTLLCFHTRPINVVVFHGSQGNICFEAGFPLRCFQRLSVQYIATQLRRWHDDWSTRGMSIPVLSY